jgi:predicted metal-dependent peptidase
MEDNMVNQVNIEEKTRKKFVRARITLLNHQPFFGQIALNTPTIFTDSIETMGVDGVSLFVNPKFVEEKSQAELCGVIAHECLHVALLHPTRRGQRDAKKWNIATDHAVNLELNKAIGSADYLMELPSDCLADPQYDGMSADTIYNRLPDDKGDDGGDPGEDKGEDGDQPGDQPGNEPGDSPGDTGGCGEVFDAPADVSVEELEAEIKQKVVQAAHSARAQGKLPGNMESMIDDLLKPVVDWKSKLREHFERVFPSDYSWMRPNRRYVHQGLYLPGVEKDGTGHIVVGVDTSGSVSDNEIKQFVGEINSICEDVVPEKVTVIYCDWDIQGVDEFEADEDFVARAPGRGGTRFTPVFEEVEKRGIQPKALIYLTDLGCHDYPTTPSYPVIWGATDHASTPPFGEVIDVKIEEAA